MDIVYCSDNNIAKYATASMASVCVNHPDERVNFHYLYSFLDDYTVNEIKKTVGTFNASVEFIKVPDKMFEGFKIGSKDFQSKWPEEAYYYFLTHEFLPSDVKRALYLDVDVLVDADISSYCNASFDGKLIAACFSDKKMQRVYMMDNPDRLYLSTDWGHEIFNSGVLLLNLEGFREKGISVGDYLDFVKWVKENGKGDDLFADQGIMNGMFVDQLKPFGCPLEYNDNVEIGGVSKIVHAAGHFAKPWRIQYSLDFDINAVAENMHPSSWLDCNIRMNAIWWRYAKLASNYADMLADADAFKERKQREYSERNPKLAKWYKHKASRFVTAVPVLPE